MGATGKRLTNLKSPRAIVSLPVYNLSLGWYSREKCSNIRNSGAATTADVHELTFSICNRLRFCFESFPHPNHTGKLLKEGAGSQEFKRLPVAPVQFVHPKQVHPPLNIRLSSKKTTDVDVLATTVLLFEADAYEPNASGGSEWFVARHLGSGALYFCDGHSKRMKRDPAVLTDMFRLHPQ